MKLLRIWLVLLLAALLPLKGAMAAAMVCPPAGGAPVQHAADHAGDRVDHHAADHAHGDHGHPQAAQAHHDGMAAEPPHASASDKCSMCSATCAALPVPSAAAGLGMPAALASASFPDLRPPAPRFQSGGPDRPPRTI